MTPRSQMRFGIRVQLIAMAFVLLSAKVAFCQPAADADGKDIKVEVPGRSQGGARPTTHIYIPSAGTKIPLPPTLNCPPNDTPGKYCDTIKR
jgi:hypothetical protein